MQTNFSPPLFIVLHITWLIWSGVPWIDVAVEKFEESLHSVWCGPQMFWGGVWHHHHQNSVLLSVVCRHWLKERRIRGIPSGVTAEKRRRKTNNKLKLYSMTLSERNYIRGFTNHDPRAPFEGTLISTSTWMNHSMFIVLRTIRLNSSGWHSFTVIRTLSSAYHVYR